MNESVVVLNYDFSFLNMVTPARAFYYLANEKVVVEKYSEKTLTGGEKEYKIPLVIRFVYMVKEIYKRKVPWSKRNVFIRDSYTCGYCGLKSNNMTVDHVIPKSRGGLNTFENTVTACFQCNNKKGNRTPSEARMKVKHRLNHPSISEFSKKWYEQLDIAKIIKSIWE